MTFTQCQEPYLQNERLSVQDVELLTGEFYGLTNDGIVLMVAVDTQHGRDNVHEPAMAKTTSNR